MTHSIQINVVLHHDSVCNGTSEAMSGINRMFDHLRSDCSGDRPASEARTFPRTLAEPPAQPLILQYASSAYGAFQKDLVLELLISER